MRILLIDDSVDVGKLVAQALSPYSVEQVLSLAEASAKLADRSYDLLLIDVNLPDGDGFTYCDKLVREGRFEQVPKVFLSGQSSVSDKVFGLNCGADDYITKPFSIAELRARIDSRLRSRKKTSVEIFNIFNFEFNNEFQKCSYAYDTHQVDLQLTPTEYRIFLTLARGEGKSLSRAELVQSVWKAHGLNIEERGVDTHIAHLRKKLLPFGNWLVSVYGKGYAFQSPKIENSAA